MTIELSLDLSHCIGTALVRGLAAVILLTGGALADAAGPGPAASSNAAPIDAVAAIRHKIQSTWDTPKAPVRVDPVVVVGDHAVAGWTQGPRGGRALLHRGRDGLWLVTWCAGDALTHTAGLTEAGVPAPQAQQLAQALARAEAGLSAARRAALSSFQGSVPVTATGHGSGQGAAHGDEPRAAASAPH